MNKIPESFYDKNVFKVFFINKNNLEIKKIILKEVIPKIIGKYKIYSSESIDIYPYSTNLIPKPDSYLCQGWHAMQLESEFNFISLLKKEYNSGKITIVSFSDDLLIKLINDHRYILSNSITEVFSFFVRNNLLDNQSFNKLSKREDIYHYENYYSNQYIEDHFILKNKKELVNNQFKSIDTLLIISDNFGVYLLREIINELKTKYLKKEFYIFSKMNFIKYKNFQNLLSDLSKEFSVKLIPFSTDFFFKDKKKNLAGKLLLILGKDYDANNFYLSIFGCYFDKVIATMSDTSVRRAEPRNSIDNRNNLFCLYNINSIKKKLGIYIENETITYNNLKLKYYCLDLSKFNKIKLNNKNTQKICDELTVSILHFQRPEYAIRALKSVLIQSFLPKEILILDDGSSLEYFNKLNLSLKKLTLPENVKINLIRKENMYLGSLRNSAVIHTNTKYLYFLDDDNILDEGSLEILYFHIKNTNASIVGSYSYILIEGDKPTFDSGKIIPFAGCGLISGLNTNTICDGNCLVNKFEYIEVGGNSEDFKLGRDDQHFFLKSLALEKKIFIVPLPLYQAQQGLVRLRNNHYSMSSSFSRIFDKLNINSLKDPVINKELLMNLTYAYTNNINFSLKIYIMNKIAKTLGPRIIAYLTNSAFFRPAYNLWIKLKS